MMEGESKLDGEEWVMDQDKLSDDKCLETKSEEQLMIVIDCPECLTADCRRLTTKEWPTTCTQPPTKCRANNSSRKSYQSKCKVSIEH
jgi:hypothetical protein